jgi:DNA-binding MarR family transcriptional regulator
MTEVTGSPRVARSRQTAEAPNPQHESALSAWATFLQAHASVIRRLGSELESETGMSISDYDVLVTLARAGRTLRMSDLADRVVLSRSGMTRRVDRLEAAGLVERRECQTDRRGAFAHLTDDGLQRLRQVSPVHLRGIQRHFTNRLEAAEIEGLRSALSKVAGGES